MNKTALLFAFSLIAGDAYCESNDELKNRLEQALKTIQDLQTRVTTLERKQTTITSTSVDKTGTTTAAAPVVAPATKADTGVVNLDEARLEISGQIMLDAIYDGKRVASGWNSTLRPSKIPVNCPGDDGCGKEGETIMSVRQSKIAFNGFIPTALGELKTEFSWDLYDNGGNDATRPHLLNAWGEIGTFGAGQYYTLFMDADVFPNTIDYWGPSGMVYIRNAQLRFTPYSHDGLKIATSLEAPGSGIDTGKVGLIDPNLSASSHQEIPDFIVNVRKDADWGHAQAAAIYRKLSADVSGTLDPDGRSVSEDGYGLNLSGVLNTSSTDRIVAQFAIGRGIAGYMNDGGNDLAPRNYLALGVRPHAEAVESIGWLVYYDHYWSDKWSSSIGYSEHIQDNTDGQSDSALKYGRYGSVNLLYYPVKNIMTGAELLWGQREDNDGSRGEDNRVQFSSKFTF
jgi:hypothetical protein